MERVGGSASGGGGGYILMRWKGWGWGSEGGWWRYI